MDNQKLFISSHAPFWHNGSSISSRSYNVMLAATTCGDDWHMPVRCSGFGGDQSFHFLCHAVGAFAQQGHEAACEHRRRQCGGDWVYYLPCCCLRRLPGGRSLIGTFLAIVVGKQIYGGMGSNPFHPSLVAFAIVMLSWKGIVNFDAALVNYDLGFSMVYPLGAVKHFGASAAAEYNIYDLLMGMQSGGIGATFGLGLILGGIYLILRGIIRWEISLSFIVGIVITAQLFHLSDPDQYAGALFHLLTGYTLIGAFFLATEDSSSPVNLIPMVLYGVCAGVLTILIRNIGFFVDGVVFAILMMNVANPLLDKIRPKAVGGGIEHA